MHLQATEERNRQVPRTHETSAGLYQPCSHAASLVCDEVLTLKVLSMRVSWTRSGGVFWLGLET
jgi:hypothetical protein